MNKRRYSTSMQMPQNCTFLFIFTKIIKKQPKFKIWRKMQVKINEDSQDCFIL